MLNPGKRAREETRFNPFERDPLSRATACCSGSSNGAPPWGNNFSSLSEELHALAAYVALPDAAHRARHALVERVRGVAAELWPTIGAEPFGSWPAGLSAFNADVDLRLVGAHGGGALERLGSALRAAPWVRNLRVISRARVPIITFEATATYEGAPANISVDVCLDGAGDGPRTTRFLKEQSRQYAAFVPVAMTLKLLLEQRALHKAFTGGVSSYRVCIMIAHLIEQQSSLGSAPAGELLLRILSHYGRVVDWSVVTSLRVRAGFEAQFDAATWKMMDVVDAFREIHRDLSAPGSAGLSSFIDADDLRRRRDRDTATGAASSQHAAHAAATHAAAAHASSDELLPVAASNWKIAGDSAIKARRAEVAFGCYTAAAAAAGAAAFGSSNGSSHALLKAFAVLWSNRSAACLAMGCHRQAMADAKRAVSLAPSWGKAHARLGAAAAAASRRAEAVGAYRAALACDPTNAQWREVLAALDDDAVAVAGASAARTASSAHELKARGNAAFGARAYAEAAGIYTMALQQVDADAAGRELAVLYSNRCATYLALDATHEALADARRSVEADPRFAKAWLRLGRAQLAVGEWEAALDSLNEGLEVEPGNEALQAALTNAVQASQQRTGVRK